MQNTWILNNVVDFKLVRHVPNGYEIWREFRSFSEGKDAKKATIWSSSVEILCWLQLCSILWISILCQGIGDRGCPEEK